MKNFLRTTLILLTLTLISSIPILSTAQTNLTVNLKNPLSATTLTSFLTTVLTVFLEVLTVVAVFYIIYSGFMLVTSRGDPKKREEAIKSFTYAVIGTAVLLGATALANIIKATVDAVKAT